MNLQPPIASNTVSAFSRSTSTWTSSGVGDKGVANGAFLDDQEGYVDEGRSLDITGHVITATIGGHIAQAGDLVAWGS